MIFHIIVVQFPYISCQSDRTSLEFAQAMSHISYIKMNVHIKICQDANRQFFLYAALLYFFVVNVASKQLIPLSIAVRLNVASKQLIPLSIAIRLNVASKKLIPLSIAIRFLTSLEI